MKKRIIQITVALVALLMGTQTGPAQETEVVPKERIGVYDSRAVAVAFAGSPAQAERFRQIKERHDKAKSAGDTKTLAEIEELMKAWQVKAHQQAFSTAPVDDILVHVSDALPGLRKDAGVTVLISKWNEPELQKHPDAETVDVTMQLVDVFKPNERQRRSAIEIQKHKPISLKQAEHVD